MTSAVPRIAALTLETSGQGSVHVDVPFYILQQNRFDVIRVGPVRGPDPCERAFGRALDRIVLDPSNRWTCLVQLLAAVARLNREPIRAWYLMGPAVALRLAFIMPWLRRKARVIYHTHDYLGVSRYVCRARFEQIVVRRAHLVVSNEIHRARALMSEYRMETEPVILPTALPAGWPVPAYSIERRKALLGGRYRDDVKLVIHPGPYSRNRLGPAVVAMLRHLPESHILLFTGMPEDGTAVRMLRRDASDLMHRIILQPWLSFAELLDWNTHADVGLLMYADDGVGNRFQCPGRLTEYAACGLPFVASAFPWVADLIRGCPALGALCANTDGPTLASAVLRVAETCRDGTIRTDFKNHLAFEHHMLPWLNAVRRCSGVPEA